MRPLKQLGHSAFARHNRGSNAMRWQHTVAKAGANDGQIQVNVGKKKKEIEEKEADEKSKAKLTETQTIELEGNKSDEQARGKVLARTVASWWKHHSKHRTMVLPEELEVNYKKMLGDGTYGECFMGKIVQGPKEGMEVVCKRAKDGIPDPCDANWVAEDELERDEEREELALGYLNVEAYINDLVMDSVQERIAAPFLGMCDKRGKKWLVFEYLNGTTLEELLIECEECYSLAPLAAALGVKKFFDDDTDSLRRLVNEVADQLLHACVELEHAGVAHRDIKPYNIIVTGGRLLLIDFGSAAAMGIRGRKGYDYNKSPCDPRYAPPEQFIEEEEWAKFDSYCVGLILVRILFTPLWGGQYFDSFSDAFHAAKYDLDAWLTRIILADRGLQERPKKGFKLPMPFKSKGDVRDEEYVELAEASCSFPDDGSLLNMCNMKEGLEVLNIKDGGICWETLRMILHKEPTTRMSADTALDRVIAAINRDRKKSYKAPKTRRMFLGLS